MTEISAERIVDLLGMQPHPEGGWFVETWRADEHVVPHALPARYEGPRAHGTSIYYLLTRDTFSAMHRLQSDEVWHHYRGASLELLLLHPGGRGETVRLGGDLEAGERPQLVVPRGTWQGARVAASGSWTLVGCTVSPGFAFDDFELGRRARLVDAYPSHTDTIRELTR